MKVLHAAFAYKPSPGVVNQMLWESRAAASSGLDWSVFLYCSELPRVSVHERFIELSNVSVVKGGLGRAVSWLTFRLSFYWRLAELSKGTDLLMLRYSSYDPLQLLFILFSRTPVLLVHHTIEYDEIKGKGRRCSRLLAELDALLGKASLRLAAGVVGVTKEIAQYENGRVGFSKRAFVYPNGIVLDDQKIVDERSDTPELLFVASYFADWHGLDLVIDAFSRSTKNFKIHLVGILPPEVAETVKGDSRYLLHGTLSSAEITKLAGRCWVGLSSFALYRKGLQEACTLKVREYLAVGLPVYAGHRDVFPEFFEFYRAGPVDAEKILEFAFDCRKVPREAVSEAARKFIDKQDLLLQLYREFGGQGVERKD